MLLYFVAGNVFKCQTKIAKENIINYAKKASTRRTNKQMKKKIIKKLIKLIHNRNRDGN